MAQPLDKQIAAALAKDARAATVAGLIDQIASAISEAQTERDRLDEISKSVHTEESAADAAADDVVKLDRKILRLNAKRDQLTARHEELLNSERQKRLAAEKAEIETRRDQLAAEIAAEWPDLEKRMIDLFERILASDAECAPHNITSAEAVARACPGNFHAVGAIPRLVAIKLPQFHKPNSPQFAWPIERPAGGKHWTELHRESTIAQRAQKAEADRREWESWHPYMVSAGSCRVFCIGVKAKLRFTDPAPTDVDIYQNDGVGSPYGEVSNAPRLLWIKDGEAARLRAMGCKVEAAPPEPDLIDEEEEKIPLPSISENF